MLKLYVGGIMMEPKLKEAASPASTGTGYHNSDSEVAVEIITDLINFCNNDALTKNQYWCTQIAKLTLQEELKTVWYGKKMHLGVRTL